MNSPSPIRRKLSLPAALFLCLSAMGLSACSCESCSGYGYVRASGLGCPSDPQSCVIECRECGATGNCLGVGSRQDKDKARADVGKLNVLCFD